MIPDHILIMGIVTVDDTDSALLEQQSLAMHIISKILMLQRSDMIRLDIGENTVIKNKALRSVPRPSLRNIPVIHKTPVLYCLPEYAPAR